MDRRSDLYSAGIVLYELLTGHVPFDGEAPVSIALKHVNERPVPPGQLRPGIPPALEAVVLRALEKDPNLRFQSAEEFIAALEQARRAPTRPIVVDPAPVEPWVEEEERAVSRWWLCGAGRCSSWPRWRSAATSLLAGGGEKVTVPNLVGRNADDAIAILQRRGLEPDIENVVSDDVARDEVISQNPEAGDEVRERDRRDPRCRLGPSR